MRVQEKVESIGGIAGEVQRKVRDWEIQIIASSAGKYLRSLCDTYFKIEECSFKDELRERILNREDAPEHHSSKIHALEKEEAVTLLETSHSSVSEENNLMSLSIIEIEKAECSSNNSTPSVESAKKEESNGEFLDISNLEKCSAELSTEVVANNTAEDTQDELVEINSESSPSVDNSPSNNEESVETQMRIATELRKQMMEKHIYILDIAALEQLPWQDIISCLLDVIKSLGHMPAQAQRRRPKNLICFNCEQKGHIVKHCPNRASKKK
ncbi:hypothetical protein NEIG_00031 [Nematocida sp. ERTm5]|nr:hypothetical protein NEIG_00031 [Nematocida sp. ERTm5]